MKIHEYQAKSLFGQYGINVPHSVLCEKKEDIENILKTAGMPCVIKAQVHSGARGKAGGIKLAKDFDSAKEIADKILGMELVSKQAGKKIVNKILIEDAIDIDKELYLSVTFDRANEKLAVIFSLSGGADIEEIALNNPEKILKDFVTDNFNAYQFVKQTGLDNKTTQEISEIINSLIKLATEKDALLVEINPLVITKQGDIIAADAKINFDDNALFRHEDIVAMRDYAEEVKEETEAQKYGLSYIKLDGTIGCMVNGAGLAMATNDVISAAGKKAANFLDVGGGASSERIEKAFEILMSDKNLEAVFINIFGGILRCDFLAEGIRNAMKTMKVTCPVIVRLEGTNKKQGAEILNNSGLKFTVVNNLNEAAEVIRKI